MMTKAQENRVRRLAHGSLPGNITAEEFVEELDRITGGSASRRTEELPLIHWGLPGKSFRTELR